MARTLNPLEAAIYGAVRPKCVLNHHQRGYVHWEWDQADGLRCRIEQPRRDFIFTPIFTAILGAGGFTLFGTTISYAALASAIATTALTIGLQYALAPKPPKPEDGRAPLTQPVPYRIWAVGQCRQAGAMMLWESYGGVMYSAQALVAHPIDEIVTYYLHDDIVTPAANGSISIPGRYGGHVYVDTRLGAVPETAYAWLVNALGAQGIWTNDHRGDGQASLAMVCYAPKAKYFNSTYPYGKPAASVVAKWVKVWDFRDEDQDPDDPSTWSWSNNSVLILGWHLCFNPFGEKHDYRRAILPVLDMWQEEADVCDEDVSLAVGGSEKRYTCSGYDTTEHGPKAGTNAILATMDGWMCVRGDGAILVVAGKYREKYCATLTDSDVVGYVNQRGVLFDEEVNRFTPKFNYPATDYSTTDTDFFEDIPAQINAGRILPEEGHYDWCTQWRQARRLGKRDWLRLQEKSRGTIYANLTGINAAYAPWIKLETPVMIPALNGKTISNRKTTLDIGKGGLAIEFVKMPDDPTDIDDWDPATDEGSAPPVPPKPVGGGIPVPIIDAVTVQNLAGSIYLRITLADPDRDDLTPVFRFRLADVGSGDPGPWSNNQSFPDVEPESGLLTLDAGPLPGDQTIEYQLAYSGANGGFFGGPSGEIWTAIQTITTTVDTTAPLALLSFSASDGEDQFTANFGTENDGHLATVAIYRVAAGDPISPRPAPEARPFVSRGISYAIPVTAPAGTWDIYVEPFNQSGIAGPLSGPETVTVT